MSKYWMVAIEGIRGESLTGHAFASGRHTLNTVSLQLIRFTHLHHRVDHLDMIKKIVPLTPNRREHIMISSM